MRYSFFVLAFFAAGLSLHAQKFTTPADRFSDNKIAYFTLTDGSTVSAYVHKIDRKKGLIEEIAVKNENGKVTKYAPAAIKEMYLPPSGWDKMASALDKAYDVQQWNQGTNVNQEYIKEGYVYFVQKEVLVKNKKQTLLMQLLNPAFCGQIMVFHDPFAAETTAIGMGGFTVAGGDDKSFYVSKNGETAYRLFKKDYATAQSKLYGDCQAFMEANKNKLKWSDFDANVLEYAKTCSDK